MNESDEPAYLGSHFEMILVLSTLLTANQPSLRAKTSHEDYITCCMCTVQSTTTPSIASSGISPANGRKAIGSEGCWGGGRSEATCNQGKVLLNVRKQA